ncbi:MAG: ATP-binding protein, partial [Terriglobales bacterium]
NAQTEAASIAESPEVRRAFGAQNLSLAAAEFRLQKSRLQGGFALAVSGNEVEASDGIPAPWPGLKDMLMEQLAANKPFAWRQTDYVLASASVGAGKIIVAMPLPNDFTQTVRQVEASQQRYLDLSRKRRLVRRTYMDLLLLLTVLVLFATTWFALFLSKLVTRPVAALAEATQEISRGRFDYRVEISAADELGDLVRSFNRMAGELEVSRRQIEASSRELSAANNTLEQRRRHIETILESIPTGVLSLNADRRITHLNQALLRLFHPKREEAGAPTILTGSPIADVFSEEMLQDLEPLLRRADRMGSTTTQMEIMVQRAKLNVAATVATLQHDGKRLGYVLVFEDLSDLLKGQKQAAWRDVARRVAHEIKNPLTPIALSADRIRRHLKRGGIPDLASVRTIDGCAETIAGAVETVRTLVDEFATLARFPTAQPQPSNINGIVETALSMFDGRLESIRVSTRLAPDLPKVMADPEAIKRALANLVDNAAEAMLNSPLREICISTAMVATGDAVEIVISDTGHGVTRELKERLFLPYFSTKQRGTGLGLAIVSRIVEDHHGSIRVEENQPSGSRFIVELPVVMESIAAGPALQHA